MRIGSLFSGYGGLDLAVQSVLGGELAWYSEIEPAACKVLAAHHPGVPNLGDITKVDWADVEPVDILTGGYPCQPFSHAGKRKGTDDERHLWPYVRDAIAAIRPMVAVFENVDGHRSLGFADVLGDLAELGMSVRWGVVRAADAGAPHGRKRIFIVAHSEGGRWGTRSRSAAAAAGHIEPGIGDSGRSTADADGVGRERARGTWGRIAGPEDDSRATADASGEGLQGLSVPASPIHGAGPRRTGAGRGAEPAADADGAGSEARRDAGPNGQRIRVEPVGPATPAADADRDGYGRELHAGGMGGVEGDTEGEPRQRQRPRGVADSGGPIGDTAPADAAGTDGQPPAGGLHAEPANGGRGQRNVAWGKYEPAIRRWEGVLGRPAPSPTVPGKNGRPRLSPKFVEWMQGLEPGHVTGHGLSAAQELKMLGNGVVPQQAALALRLLGVGA